MNSRGRNHKKREKCKNKKKMMKWILVTISLIDQQMLLNMHQNQSNNFLFASIILL